MRSVPRVVATAAAAFLSATVCADNITVYDNFTGPEHGGFDYNWGLGWTVAGTDVDPQFGVEQAFLVPPSDSGALSDIWVAVWRVPTRIAPGPHEVTVAIVANTDGRSPKPEDVLEDWTLTTFEDWSGWSAPHHLVSELHPQLQAGQSFWIWVRASVATTYTGWAMNTDPRRLLPHTLRREQDDDWLPVSNETASAMRVDVLSATCEGDVDGDGSVGFSDILAILAAWGPCKGECPEDIDDSGAVDFGDILVVLAAWGPCP